MLLLTPSCVPENGNYGVESKPSTSLQLIGRLVPPNCQVISVSIYRKETLELERAWIALPPLRGDLAIERSELDLWAFVSRDRLPVVLAEARESGGMCDFWMLDRSGGIGESLGSIHRDGMFTLRAAQKNFAQKPVEWKFVEGTVSVDDLLTWCIESGCSFVELRP